MVVPGPFISFFSIRQFPSYFSIVFAKNIISLIAPVDRAAPYSLRTAAEKERESGESPMTIVALCRVQWKKNMIRLDIVLADKNADRRMPFVHRTLNCLSMKYNNSIVVASLYLYVLLHSFNCIRNATAQPPTDRVWYIFSCYNILFDHFTHNQWHTHTAHSPNTETHILHLGGSAKNPNQ